MQIHSRPVDGLIPYARNSRTHTDEQVAQIAASIREFGWTNPVLLDGASGIIAGHGRVLAARKLGMAEVPCIELSHLSEAQKKAYIIADNKLALNAGWDNELLALEFGELQELGFDLDLTGFDADELEALAGSGELDGDDELRTLDGEKYTMKLDIPIYEPKGERPDLANIFDRSKTESLIAEIEATEGIPQDVREFLSVAAERHTVFNYERIAEYYAHAPDAVKRLFEDSALVIIDYHSAVERGYVKMTKELIELAGQNEEL